MKTELSRHQKFFLGIMGLIVVNKITDKICTAKKNSDKKKSEEENK